MSYLSSLNYNGPDSFSWKASDGTLNSATSALASLTVVPVNDAPTILGSLKAGREDEVFTFGVNDFTSVFSDVDSGDTLQSIKITDLPESGVLLLRSGGQDTNVPLNTPLTLAQIAQLIYVPDPDYNGTDSFQWSAADNETDSAPATVTLTVAPMNELPTITSSFDRTGSEDRLITFTPEEFRSKFSDVDGGTFTSITITNLPGRGELLLDQSTVPGNTEIRAVTANQVIAAADISKLTYIGDRNYVGTDSFGWTLSDGQGPTQEDTALFPATVGITLTSVNDAPTFNLAGTLLTTLVGEPTKTVTNWASNFSPGPADEAGQNLAGYFVVGVSDSTLFKTQPTIGNDGTLTYQTAETGLGGSAVVVIQALDDGGTVDGGNNAATQTFTIAVAPRPTVTLLPALNRAEGRAGTSSTFTFQVSLSTASTQTVRVGYSTADITATAGSDYVAISDGALTFTPGQTLQTITVTAQGDNTIEANESFKLTLSSVTNGVLGTVDPVVATLINDDFSATQSFGPTAGVGPSDIDLVWRNDASGDVYIWDMNGPVPTAGIYLKTVPDANWQIQSVGDFTGDSQLDVLWRNVATGELLVWELNGTTFVQDVFLRSSNNDDLSVIDSSWEIAAVTDFTGDGQLDIFWRNAISGRNIIWEMNGGTRVADPEIFQVEDLSWKVEGTGDFNGDGKADILWRNEWSGDLVYWTMNGTEILDDVYLDYTVAGQDWQIEGIGDFDNDGKLDLFWRNYATGLNYIWTLDGSTGVTQAIELPKVFDRNWRPETVADYTKDGNLDILWRNYATGENTIWQMSGTVRQSDIEVLRADDVAWEVNPFAV